MKECGNCTKCCEGAVSGTVYSRKFGNGIPCSFLNNTCQIYHERPRMCKNYFCAWAQELLSDNFFPARSNILVSVEIDDEGVQFLKVITNRELSVAEKDELKQFTSNNSSYYTEIRLRKVIPIQLAK